MTLSDTDAISVVVVSKDISDWNRVFKEGLGEVNFVGDVATVDLEFEEVRFFLFERERFHLGVSNEPDCGAVFFELGDGLVLAFFGAFVVLFPFSGVLSERLLLGAAPVFVEPPFSFIRDMVSPDSFQSPKASWSFNVADHADAHHWRGLNNSDGFNDLFFVHFVAISVDFTDNVGHASFVADESGEMTFCGFVVFGVGLDAAEVAAGTLAGKEAFGSVAGSFEFTVRHFLVLRF